MAMVCCVTDRSYNLTSFFAIETSLPAAHLTWIRHQRRDPYLLWKEKVQTRESPLPSVFTVTPALKLVPIFFHLVVLLLSVLTHETPSNSNGLAAVTSEKV